jgi:HEAT repeat protein
MAGSYLVPMELPHLDAALRDVDSATAEVRWVACLALAGAEGSRVDEAIAALERTIDDQVEEVRAQALEGLVDHARYGRGVDLDVLRGALADESDLVRMTALEAGDLFLDDPAAEAIRMLDDDAPGVRVTAAQLLGEWRAASAVEPLVRSLADQDRVVRVEVALALVRLGDDRGEPLVVESLGGDEQQAIAAALALGELGSAGAAPALRAAASGWLKSAGMKGVAGAALARCGDATGLEILGRMLASVRGSTRQAALGAIARLPVPGIAPRVAALIDRGGAQQASSAIRTLIAVAEVDRPAALRELEQRRGVLAGELAAELEEALAALAGAAS